MTPDEMKAYNKTYYENNKEKIKAQSKVRYEINKEKIKAKHRAYDEAHREERRTYLKAYRKANAEKLRAKDKTYRDVNREGIKKARKADREANKDKFKARDKAYYEANREKRKAYRVANKAKIKAYMKAQRIQTHYGITIAEYSILANQNDRKCAICGSEPPGLHVDHNHVTGEVRGLLCTHCNTMLGHAFDNPETLRRAADYLELPPVKFNWPSSPDVDWDMLTA